MEKKFKQFSIREEKALKTIPIGCWQLLTMKPSSSLLESPHRPFASGTESRGNCFIPSLCLRRLIQQKSCGALSKISGPRPMANFWRCESATEIFQLED